MDDDWIFTHHCSACDFKGTSGELMDHCVRMIEYDKEKEHKWQEPYAEKRIKCINIKEHFDKKLGLEFCISVAKYLKEQFPNDVMKIEKNTIIEYSTANSRLIGGKKAMHGMANTYAYYSKSRNRIVIKQKTLQERELLRTKIKSRDDRTMLYGNFALVELMCHELAHHRTKSHGNRFKQKYSKLFAYMVNQIISGRFYEWLGKL